MKTRSKFMWIIQSLTNYGWEDETAEETREEADNRLREYRENSPLPCRLVRKREK